MSTGIVGDFGRAARTGEQLADERRGIFAVEREDLAEVEALTNSLLQALDEDAGSAVQRSGLATTK